MHLSLLNMRSSFLLGWAASASASAYIQPYSRGYLASITGSTLHQASLQHRRIVLTEENASQAPSWRIRKFSSLVLHGAGVKVSASEGIEIEAAHQMHDLKSLTSDSWSGFISLHVSVSTL